MPSISRYYSSTAAKTTLSSAIDSSSTSLQLAAASGLPSQYPFTLILEKDTANEEIVEVTGLVGSAYTITRNIDGSGAKSHSIGALVEHGVSARDFSDSRSHEAATSAHGVTGDVVGTGGAQTLTNKTLTSPTINTPTIAGATLTGAVTSSATVTVTGSIVVSGGTITGLSSAGMIASSAAPKNYVDSILGSATAASTSAASAATSATAAATSAASAATSASSAATSASSALTSQTAAATSAASAATSATAAATSAASALTSQTSAAASATAAATSASSASTSATSAAASATTASNSAATATTSAGQAATSATSAATSASSALTSASSAAASATAASTSASSAATSAASAAASVASIGSAVTDAQNYALAASTSASSASTSASSAATSASSAATSATAAEAAYDSFDDRYLGAKGVPPTLDNDGNALIAGALYWDTNTNAMYAWTGTAWGSISSTAEIFRYRFTAAGGETTISGMDDNGITLSYLVGKEQVYLNGVLLVRTQDYTATSGSSLTGLSPALSASDVVEIITFTPLDVANALLVTLFDAKGDLLVGSAADTAGKLPVGTDGYFLSADSSTGTGLAWAAVPEPDLTSIETMSIMGGY